MTFQFNPFTSVFERVPIVVTGGTGGGTQTVVYVTLNSGHISAKAITLGTAPVTPGMTTVEVVGGCIQTYGSDFTVSGTTLSWAGLGLETILSVGDVLVISY